MLPSLRRKNQKLSDEEVQAVIARNTHGVLALAGDDGYPYALPISYAYADGAFYFHSAPAGHKIDAIARSGKASLAIVDADEVDGPGYTTHFRSVIAFGRIRLITDAREKMETAMMLGARYNPGVDQEKVLTGQMAASFAHMHMIALDIDEMTGKESKHFATQRRIEKGEERA
ncbi:pyridoxamine 5'-phosphate oxidase family protein [Slackia exigua]|uniref:pyridoxamine 5'-phosphate oxidase family protein n=1 Tax=Slackia exigua TaxID=84109 RepID=UPI0028E859CA|nr:pyridoxamine 5'-phosphate oxidase family protein [Slackia exigua]